MRAHVHSLAKVTVIAAGVVLGGDGYASSEPTDDSVLSALRPRKGGLTFRGAIARALEASPEVMEANAVAARGRSRAQTAWMGLSPRIDLQASYVRLSRVEQPPFNFEIPELTSLIERLQMVFPDEPPPPASGSQEPFEFPQVLDNYALRASIQVPVSQYFVSLIHAYRMDKRGETLTRYQALAVRETVAARTVDALLAVVRARATLDVARDSRRALEAHLDRVDKLSQAGLTSAADRSQVEAQLANAKLGVLRSEGLVAVSEAVLRRILGEDASAAIEHGEDLLAETSAELANVDEAVSVAMARRYELRALKEAISAQESLSRFNFGEMLPRLAVGAGVLYANPNQRVFPLTAEFRSTWDVNVSLSWSPHDLARGLNGKRDADRDAAKLRANLKGLVDSIALEVQRAYTNLATTRGSIVSAKNAVDAAQKAYEQRGRLLEAGESTNTQLLDAEAALRRAQLQLVGAYLDVQGARTALDRALGRLVADERGEGT